MLLKDLIANPAAYAEQRVTVNGWVRANRKQKSFGFIALNDGTALANVQLVYDDSLANFDAAGHPECLHFRANFPRRKFQHRAPCRRVLDDRAGDRLR